jgi:hypothetical protein
MFMEANFSAEGGGISGSSALHSFHLLPTEKSKAA